MVGPLVYTKTTADLMKYWVRSLGPRYSSPPSTSSRNSPPLPLGAKVITQVWWHMDENVDAERQRCKDT